MPMHATAIRARINPYSASTWPDSPDSFILTSLPIESERFRLVHEWRLIDDETGNVDGEAHERHDRRHVPFRRDNKRDKDTGEKIEHYPEDEGMVSLTRNFHILPGLKSRLQVPFLDPSPERVTEHENPQVIPPLRVKPGKLVAADHSGGKSSVHWQTKCVTDLETPPASEVELPLEHAPEQHNYSEIESEDEESYN